MTLSIGQRLRLITNNVIPVRCARIQRIFEELGNEWRRKGENENLVVLRCLFRKSLNGGWAHSKMIPANKIIISPLNQLPHLRALQMLQIIMIRRSQIGTHGPIMACNHHTASSSLLLLVHTVFDSQALGLDSVVQDGGIFIVANTAQEDGGVRREEILGAASGVLGTAASDELSGVVVQQVFIDSKVLFFGEDSIVGFEAVFLKESLVALSLDVWEANVLARRRRCYCLTFICNVAR